jgi:regulator of cell morphogenesis and NO signaling
MSIGSTAGRISPEMRINEVIGAHPDTVRVFHELGLDACCGGGKTIAEASLAHRLDLGMVLESLNAVAGS